MFKDHLPCFELNDCDCIANSLAVSGAFTVLLEGFVYKMQISCKIKVLTMNENHNHFFFMREMRKSHNDNKLVMFRVSLKQM